MRNFLAYTFILFLGALSAGVAVAQDRPIDFSSQGANVFSAPGAQGLSLPSQASPAAVVATFLQAQGVRPATVNSLVVTKSGRSSRTGLTHLRFAQVVEGLTVHGTYVKASVHDDGGLASLIENLAPPSGLLPSMIDERAALDAALDEVHPGVSPSLSRGTRSKNSVTYAGDEFFYRDPTVTLVVIPMQSGDMQEGYLVETWSDDENLLHHTLIDRTGAVLQVELRTNNDTYKIYPDHPGTTNQVEVSGPGIGSEGAPAVAESPLGWLDLDTPTTLSPQLSTNISGNNVHAYLDTDKSNGYDLGGTLITDGVFSTSADLTAQPNTAANKEVAVQNLFYFNNVIHDKLFSHGFDEAAGNFQNENFTNFGAGNDAVDAEAQDGSGVNNANFGTPADGSPPRMQMFLWGDSFDHSVTITGGSIYSAVGAAFGASPPASGLTGDVVLVNDNSGITSDGCESLIGTGVAGKIALIDRGDCDFIVKAQNAEDAGAVGVIVANNGGASITEMGDSGNGGTITIASVFVSTADGDAIKLLASPEATLKLSSQMRDGDVDSDIIWHEYGHGLTWRMIGGMSGAMSGAIGEGMSDVLAILANNNDRVGEYSTGDPLGIRSHEYTGYAGYRTYGDFSSGLGVHRNGEIYAAAVWRVWELFQATPVSQDTLFDYVIDGMNHTPSGPTMEDMRDGILQAANGSGDECLIWEGFADLGIGTGATGTTSSVITESFAVPGSCNGGNSAPVANPDALTVVKGGTETVLDSSDTSVLDNDDDDDGDSLTAAVVTGPLNGTLTTFNADGTFSYTHDGSDTASDSFTYRANDGTADSNVTTVFITITGVGTSEEVIITKATYNAKKDKLDVEATSSDAPNADLTLTVYEGTNEIGVISMSYNSKKVKYSASMSSPPVVPTSVTVTSTGGGEATFDLGGGSDGGGGGGGSCNGKGNKPGCP